MGVKNLWDILDSCKKKLPLHHLQNKKVCVDLSCWLVQLHTAHRSSAFTKDKVYLKNLFHRIRALLALNCSLVFVTDGAIPAVKLATYRRRLGANPNADAARDSQPSSTSLRRNMGSEFSCMIKEAKRLGLALGIPCLDGVEEAEAQCALLDFASLCDGCFTSDSDAFLFGARTVYRDVFIGEGGYVICYEMEDIEKKLGFGRNSLISLAVLLGSDYSNGVHGFGPETACRLVKSVGDDSILDQILSDGVKATRKCKAKNIGNKADDILPKTSTCEVGMTQDSDGQFCDVINAYLKPKCHPPDSEAVRRVCCQHPFRRPELQKVCEEYFEWDPEKTDQYILPKIAERELRRFSNLRSASSALGLKPMFNNIPVPCPVSAIVKQRKLHGSVCYEVSWRNIDGLQVSVVPGELVNSACPEKINEFFEKKDGEKKQKRRGRPKKSSAQDAVKDVDSRLQELLLGIESESSTFPHTTSGRHSAYAPSVAPGKDIVDLSSPSPPLRACKIAKSQRFSGSTTGAANGIDLQCQSLLTGMMESQSSTQSSGAEISTQDDNLIDLCSPPHPVVGKPRSNKTERRALADISNFPEKGGLLRDSASLDKVEAAASGRHLESSPSVSHETESSGIITNCSWRSGDSGNAIDLSSPSPIVGDRRVRVYKHDDPDVIDICDGESEHERKARDLRSFLDSIRNELL